MGKIYKIETNGYDAFVTVDDNNRVSKFTSCEDVYDVDIRDVEDDSSWETDCYGMDFDELCASMGAGVTDSDSFCVDEIDEEDYAAVWNSNTKYEVRFDGGVSNDGKAVNFMSVAIGGIVLYAETAPIPDDANLDEYGYEDLKTEIILQAKLKGIDPEVLKFWWD